MNNRFKYPRTPHLPWSPGIASDDIRCIDLKSFVGKQIVVTEKMDGENTTLYHDFYHARSIDSRHHPSRDWIKGFHGAIKYQIPKGWRICGENLFAKHSIFYGHLKSYFYGLSIWDENNLCLSWEETLKWFEQLNIVTPPILYQGLWDESLLKRINIDLQNTEGYVVRLAESFEYQAFNLCVAKWVRKGHVQSDEHWQHVAVVPNQLLGKKGDHHE